MTILLSSEGPMIQFENTGLIGAVIEGSRHGLPDLLGLGKGNELLHSVGFIESMNQLFTQWFSVIYVSNLGSSSSGFIVSPVRYPTLL